MKIHRAIIILALASLTACSGEREAVLALDPVPFAMKTAEGILPRLSTGPIEGPFAGEVQKAGALASTTVYYSPLEQGDKVIFMTAYWFPEDQFDVLQKPDSPPLFGFEVLRQDGKVLSVAGPVDSIFAPDTPDGKNLIDLYGAIYLRETYRAAE
jgi:hypothetical protein